MPLNIRLLVNLNPSVFTACFKMFSLWSCRWFWCNILIHPPPYFHMPEQVGSPETVYAGRLCDNIRIHHECEGGIEKCVPRITNWHHEACRVITIGDREGRIFLSHPHTNNGAFFLLTTLKYLIYISKTWKRLPENPEYAEMGHGDVIFNFYNDVTDRRAASMRLFVFLSFLRAGMGV